MSSRPRRSVKRKHYEDPKSADTLYPFQLPRSPIEREIHTLNLQCFSHELLARADDILVYALFAQKRHPKNGYLKFVPSTASANSVTTPEDAETVISSVIPIWRLQDLSAKDKAKRLVDALGQNLSHLATPELRRPLLQ